MLMRNLLMSRLFVLWVPHQQLVPLDCFDYNNRCHIPIGFSCKMKQCFQGRRRGIHCFSKE
ncbi:hypothetical protein Hdeb2414_s0002g00055791 [Helianthus debilis subsp. tardiflorus]